jgi:putative ABC transport system permease protein
MLHDFKYVLRLWSKRPWPTVFAAAALAIGLGATTGVFSVVNALLLRSIPFYQPERLTQFQQFIPPHNSAKEFHEWRQHSDYLADTALYEEIDANLSGAAYARRIHVAQTTWNFLSVLGVRPVLGTGFAPDEDVDGTGWGTPGRNAVAVISYGLWQQVFGGDPNALGATIRVDGIALTVVGVAPPEFNYPNDASVWKPAAFSAGNNGWQTIARLKPRVSWAQARAAFAVEVNRQSGNAASRDRFFPTMTSLQDALAGPARKASQMLLWAVALILLIACTNVASLLLARAANRRSEMQVRYSLGATRARLVQLQLVECSLLSCIAMLAGLLLANWITTLAAKVEPLPLGGLSYSIWNGHVVVFTLIVFGVTVLALGILPSLQVGRGYSFRQQMAFRQSRSSRQMREGLVAAQVMLTMMLLASSVCVGSAFTKLMHMDRGYDVDGIVTASVSLDGSDQQLNKRQLAYFEEVIDRIRQLPGVRSASATEFLPLYASGFIGGQFGLDGRPAARSSTMIPVMAGYFQTMGGRMVAGRGFTEAEVSKGADVAIVNERFAANFGDPKDVLNHEVTIGKSTRLRVVGIVKGMEYETDPTIANGNQVFVPSETPGSFSSTFVARVDGRAENELTTFRDAIQSVDPRIPVFSVKTMSQRLDDLYARPRFYRSAGWSFAAFAALLTLLGIYGTISYAVAERTQEMGVRMALGRTPAQLRSMLLRHGLTVIAVSAVLGTAGAQVTGHLLASLIAGAKPIGLGVSVGLVAFFALVASTSIWSATVNIAKLDITAILRSD